MGTVFHLLRRSEDGRSLSQFCFHRVCVGVPLEKRIGEGDGFVSINSVDQLVSLARIKRDESNTTRFVFGVSVEKL